MEFKWWYLVIFFVLVFFIFGKGKGGLVTKRVSAKFEVLDPRFEGCKPEADYSVFKKGSPDKIDIEIESLNIPIGEELEFILNNTSIATVEVKNDREAEFEHWSDEDITFPVIHAGDILVVRYRNTDVLKGIFHTN